MSAFSTNNLSVGRTVDKYRGIVWSTSESRAEQLIGFPGVPIENETPYLLLFGFTNIITAFLDNFKPEHVAVVFDREEPTFRHERYTEYKANRPDFPEDLGPQLLKIKELLDLMIVQVFDYINSLRH